MMHCSPFTEKFFHAFVGTIDLKTIEEFQPLRASDGKWFILAGGRRYIYILFSIHTHTHTHLFTNQLSPIS